MNPSHLLAIIQSRYHLEPIQKISRLTGGEWKTLWRLDGAQSAYVASLSHPTTTVDSLVYEHQLLDYLQAQLPQIPAPLLAQDGSSYFVEAGRIVSLFPLMPGNMADRDEGRLPAARFLATFHRIGLAYPNQSARPGIQPWAKWDWCAAEWTQIEEALASRSPTTSLVGQRLWQATGVWATQILERRAQIGQVRAHVQQWLAELAHTGRDLTHGLLHDDFHKKNVLMADGKVTALLDWDSCHPDWLVMDVANATWEFCLDRAAHTLNPHTARLFLQAYVEAGGPVPVSEFDLIIEFICCRRMIEIMDSLRGIVTGGTWDESPDYLVHNLLSLENLRTVRLDLADF